jgi:hypothetical protein
MVQRSVYRVTRAVQFLCSRQHMCMVYMAMLVWGLGLGQCSYCTEWLCCCCGSVSVLMLQTRQTQCVVVLQHLVAWTHCWQNMVMQAGGFVGKLLLHEQWQACSAMLGNG